MGACSALAQAAMDFVHPDDRNEPRLLWPICSPSLASRGQSNLRHRDSNNDWHWVESTVTNLVDEPTVRGIVVNSRVVDERRPWSMSCSSGLHDPLTGLANHGLFASVSRTRCTPRTGANVRLHCCLSTLRFKTVNDGFGHDAGDHLLIR